VAAGAVILEKHLTLDRSATGPDHFFSLTPDAFAEYVSIARRAADALGSGAVCCDEGQRQARTLARGSIIVKSDIARGATITADLLTVRRPGTGLDPMHWERVVGRTAAHDLPAGTPLAWSSLGPSLRAGDSGH
jgi:N,N'-diacetyllegionaminate synthase